MKMSEIYSKKCRNINKIMLYLPIRLLLLKNENI